MTAADRRYAQLVVRPALRAGWAPSQIVERMATGLGVALNDVRAAQWSPDAVADEVRRRERIIRRESRRFARRRER